MCTSENENKQLYDEKNNQKFLVDGGVCAYFGNVFDQNSKSKIPTIKHKLRKILVDFGLCQTFVEINQKSDCIKVWYQDSQATELKGTLLQRYNQVEESQAIEISINLEGSMCSLPKVTRGVKTYTGLTKLLYQELIDEPKARSMIDDSPYNQIETIIRKGNLVASEPLSAILTEEVD